MASADSPPPNEGSIQGPNIRALYLSSLGAIFLIANLSNYVQFPGLLSSVGVEPAATRVLPKLFPELQHHLEENNIDGDSFIESLCLVGVVLSSIVASGLVQHGSLFVALTAIYLPFCHDRWADVQFPVGYPLDRSWSRYGSMLRPLA